LSTASELSTAHTNPLAIPADDGNAEHMTTRSLIDLTALSIVFPDHVVTTTALIELGIPMSTIRKNRALGGPWQQLHPGVLLLTTTPPTRRQKLAGALQYVPGSVVTGLDALALHGVRTSAMPTRIHLLVKGNGCARSTTGIRVEKTPTPPRPVLRHNLLVAPLARATIDATRQMTSQKEVSTLMQEVVFHHGVRLDELNSELIVGAGRGTTLPKQVLREIALRVHTDVARSARLLVDRAGLPPPRWNVPIADPAGNPLGTVTGTWAEIGLAWDVHAFNHDPTSYPVALKRGSLLAAQGLRVLHTAATEIRATPDKVIENLRAAHSRPLTTSGSPEN
jgi:hypothetical protein